MDSQHAQQYDHQSFPRGSQIASTTESQNTPVAYGTGRHQAVSPTSQPDLETGDSGPAVGSYEYAQGQQFNPQMQSHALQYHSEFGSDSARPQFQAYPSNMLYNLASQGSQSADYEAVQQFNPRQSTGIEGLSNQFGVPQYFSPTDQTRRSSQHPQTYSAGNYQQTARFSQRASADPATSAPQYMPGVTDYSSASISAVMDPVEQPRSRTGSDDPFASYYSSLRRVFRKIQRGDLLSAAHQLLQTSEWVSSHALELVSQDARLEFWEQFNISWLALLQKQKESSQEMIDHSQPPPSGQTILQEDLLERMASELVRMCDGMERHGLVDYQMGVWEEEIMSVLLECLQILEGDLEDYGTSEAPASRSQRSEAAGRSG